MRRKCEIKIPITEDLRKKAKIIAEQRDTISKYRGGTYLGMLSTVDMNWVGAIAEVYLSQKPYLKPSQPLVVKGSNTLESDISFNSVGIEVKCQLFPKMYPRYLINKRLHYKKQHLSKIYILCGINDEPDVATVLYIFGIIKTEDISKYPVESRYQSPAYDVPMSAIIHFSERNERMYQLCESVFGKDIRPTDVRDFFGEVTKI